ncbi:MAG: diguanylate cyclase [Polyangiaceae bacterium]|nr:diguanylate cyclase [Polyangiaceae bacterium]
MVPRRLSAKARILVVEDSRNQRAHLRSLLEQRGFEVDEATGGIEALRQIKALLPDVVLLDVMLDDLDGYSVCRWIRLAEATRDVVVIMLTVRGDVADRVEGLHVGADDYLPKPFADEELEARIYAALRIREAKAELRRRNAELEAMLARTEQLAMTDEVTGLYNRRRFLDLLRREWATAKRYGHPVSVAIADLDGFKVVNDYEGHSAGDDALRRVGTTLSGSLREVDVCARYGGDEFAIMLPHTSRDGAAAALARIAERLTRDCQGWSKAMAELGISMGVASSEDPALGGPEDLIEAADRALYEAKRAGGRRVLIARDGMLRP